MHLQLWSLRNLSNKIMDRIFAVVHMSGNVSAFFFRVLSFKHRHIYLKYFCPKVESTLCAWKDWLLLRVDAATHHHWPTTTARRDR